MTDGTAGEEAARAPVRGADEGVPRDRLARLPQVDAVLRHAAAADPVNRFGRARVVTALREALDEARTTILGGGEVPEVPDLIDAAVARLEAVDAGALHRVLNATGVVLHTNLGRAPLSAAARSAVMEAAGYTSLEYDLASGERGSRTRYVGEVAAEVCGAEAATVVNNGAAALMLVLGALAADREVIVSRGELIEIGGSYRLPDVMAASGARLVEVGTTNRTRTGDYRAAASEETALLLKVHQSNYRMVGFAETAPPEQLADLANELGIPFVYDVGSGLVHRADDRLGDEPSVAKAVEAGADLVIFSGDKLLGGPQAGIIAGRSDLVGACRRHPLARAVRIDKLQRAALEATLRSYLDAGDDPPLDLPVLAMLHAAPDQLEARARELARHLGGGAEASAVRSVVGGGAVPGERLPSWGVVLTDDDPTALARRLRSQDPPVIGRIEGDRVVLDLRTIPPTCDTELADLVLAARG